MPRRVPRKRIRSRTPRRRARAWAEERSGPSPTISSTASTSRVTRSKIRIVSRIRLTGRKFDAHEAERLNLINKVVPAAELDQEVEELARAICSIPREGIASSRGVAHMSYDLLGYPGMFTFHYGMHPHAVMMERKDDEFDFRQRIAEVGLKKALAERDEVYSGRYWGW